MVWRKGSETLAAFYLVLGRLDEQLMEKGVHNIGNIGKDERETSHRPRGMENVDGSQGLPSPAGPELDHLGPGG